MPKLYSAPEVASVLGVKLDTLYRYARKGNLRGVKIGKLWRFTEANLQEFIESRRYFAYPDGNCSKLLPEILHEAGQRLGDQGNVICGTSRVSYSEIDLLSDGLATALVERGVGPGDRVLLILPSSPQFIVACFAIWKARGIVVPEDSAIRPGHFRHILEETQPTAVIVDRNLAVQLETMPEALRRVKAIFLKDRTFALSGVTEVPVESLDAVPECEARPAVLPTGARPDDVVSITYTSGSTGAPKGVMHTHESWLTAASFTRDYLGISARDKIVIPLPLHHAYAFRQILAYMLAGGSLVIAADIYSALNLMREERPTALSLVPAACNILIDHFATVLREADSLLRYVEIGAGSMTLERLESLARLLPTTPVHLPYGLTEARVGFLKPGPDGVVNRIMTCSLGLQVQVVDGQGQPVGRGEAGEIVLQGRGLMKGYCGDLESAQQKLKTEGFRTGDMGRVDENGEIGLLGRLDDVLKIGGRKISPLEIEMTLNRHPAVVESAVLGVADPQGILEQVLHAFVVPRKVDSLSTSELLTHCRQYLEPYKIPAQIHFRSSLPKSPLGKIQRHLIATETAMILSSTEEECHASAD